MRILGETDAPGDLRNAPDGSKMSLCKQLVKQAQALPAGKALLVEFANKREMQVIKVDLYRIRKFMDIPLKVRIADTLMWISIEETAHDSQS
jgi:hypothetical protein